MEIKYLIKIWLLTVIITTLVDASTRLSQCTCDRSSIECGDLPDVSNGEYVLTHPNQGFFGSTAYLECDPGFKPSQASTITCLITGAWEEAAFCQTSPFAGTSYVTAFPRVTIDAEGGTQIRRLYITTDQPTQINITSPFTSFSQTLITSESATVDFPINYTLIDNGTLSSRVITIIADNPINVVTLDSRDGPSQLAFDAWLLRPIDRLSNEYIVITTDMAPKFVIVGLTDGTNCSVTRPGEGPRTILLDKDQTIPIFIDSTATLVNNDLSGTVIECTEIVAVYSGGFFSTVPLSQVGSRDLNFVQLVGVERFYDKCLFAPFEPRNEFEIKAVASQDSTTITCFDGFGVSITVINRGDVFQEYFTAGFPVVCTADKPILAAQFSANQGVGNVPLGDSSMVLCVDPDFFLNRYEFFVPNEYDQHRLRIVIDTDDKDQLLLNGSPVVSSFETVFAPEGVTWVYVDVAPNTYYVLETTEGAVFGADLYVLLRFGQFTQSLGQLYS